MQLATIRTGDGLALGVKHGSQLVTVRALQEHFGNTDEKVPYDIHAVIHEGATALDRLATLVEAVEAEEELWHSETELVFGPCVTRPDKIIGIGLNYRQHAEESGVEVPRFPVLFSKFNNSLAAHGESVPIPRDTQQMDYEAELAVVIGRETRGVSVDSALDSVFGYCGANDISARDLQFVSGQWLLGKTPDKFFPVGPYLVTADEVVNPNDLWITCHINGEKRQDSNTGDMIFTVPEIISYVSRYITLMPGDVISTGTPHGVALGMKPHRWLQPGDEMVVEIEGLGKLINHIVAPVIKKGVDHGFFSENS